MNNLQEHQSVKSAATKTSATGEERSLTTTSHYSHADRSFSTTERGGGSTIGPLPGEARGMRKTATDEEPCLNAANIPFFGRSDEIEELKKLYEQVVAGSSSSAAKKTDKQHDRGSDLQARDGSGGTTKKYHHPAAFIWGQSGTGKSRLAKQFFDDIILSSASKNGRDQDTATVSAGSTQKAATSTTTTTVPKPYIIEGKHDENTGVSDPFSVIIQALTDFCDQVTQSESPEELRRIQQSIGSILKDEGKSILRVVPAFRRVLNGNGGLGSGNSDTGSVASDQSSMVSSAIMLPQDFMFGGGSGLDSSSKDTAQNRLRYTFLSLIKAIATKERPLIFFLDDLQWCSEVTTDLIQTLLSDKNLSNFFLVGTIRQEISPHTNEVMELDYNSSLSVMLRSLRENLVASTPASSDDRIMPTAPWLDIHLSNMSLAKTQQLIAHVLEQPAEDLIELASDLYHKTQGNVFFILQLLEQIKSSSDLDASKTNDKNTAGYNIQNIHSVVELIASKIDQLSPKLRTALIVASYIQFSFNISTLCTLLDTLSTVSFDSFVPFKRPSSEHRASEQKLEKYLEEAVLNGLLSHTIGSETYRFHHDRVQQAAKSLVPFGEERNKLRHRIGLSLLDVYHGSRPNSAQDNHSKTDQRDGKRKKAAPKSSTGEAAAQQGQSPMMDSSMLFIAADHLNSVPTKDHVFIAKLNTEVSEQAADLGAPTAALKYSHIAFDALEKVRKPWENHYDLALKSFRIRADVELALGNFDIGYGLVEVLCKHSKSVEDTIPAIIAKATALGRDDKKLESVSTCLKAAQTAGAVPKRGVLFSIVKELIWIKMYIQRHSDEDILSLPIMTDQKQLLSMKLLHQVIGYGVQTDQIMDWLVATVKIFRATIKHGICNHAAIGFIFLSVLSNAQNDKKTGQRYAKLATAILERTNGQGSGGLVYCVNAMQMRCWNETSANAMKLYHQGFYLPLEYGDFEAGFVCGFCSVVAAYYDGYPLDRLLNALNIMADEMELYKVTANTHALNQWKYFIPILLGKTRVDWENYPTFGDTTLSVIGSSEPISEKEIFYPLLHGYMSRILISILLSKYEIADGLRKKLDKLDFKSDPNEYYTTILMYTGLVAAGRYRETRDKKHLQRLRSTYKTGIDIWKTRGKRTMNRGLIVKAEYKALTVPSKNWRRVKIAYDMAIAVSTETREPFKTGGHVHEAGLACEMAGEYFIRIGKRNLGSQYITSAYHYYQLWGAKVKTDQMKAQRAKYINAEQLDRLVVNSSSMDARRRTGTTKSDGVVQFGGTLNGSGPGDDDALAYPLIYDAIQTSRIPSAIMGNGENRNAGGANSSSVGDHDFLLSDHEHANNTAAGSGDDDVSVLSDAS